MKKSGAGIAKIKWTWSLFMICWCILFLVFSATAQTKPPTVFSASQRAAIHKLAKDEMQQQHIVGMSIGIVINNKIVMTQGYGLSDIKKNIPASATTAYKIGSVSKQFVAAAIMLLVQQGKISLTDSLPQFFNDAPASWGKITVRNLLNHTSGLPRESPLLDNMKVQPDSLLIRASYDRALLFPTGTAWKYCNLGYFMLAEIIRLKTNQPFTHFMEEQVFRKYDLHNTRTTLSEFKFKNMATGYVTSKPDSIYPAKAYVALRPSGAFISTVNDLLKWEMVMSQHQMISQSHWQQMWTDTVSTSPNSKEYYGYGWDVDEYKQHLAVHHDGTIPGFTSSYFRFVKDRVAIIVLTNTDMAYPRKIASGIADIILRTKP